MVPPVRPAAARSIRAVRWLVVEIVAITVLTLALVWALVAARQAILLIYISTLLAIGFSPVIRLIERQTVLPVGSRGLPRWLAILCLYVLIVGTLTGIGLVVYPVLLEQARGLIAWLPDAMRDGQRFLIARGLVKEQLTVGEIVQQGPGNSDLVSTVLLTVFDLVGGAFGLVTILILTFYLLIESESLFDTFVRLFPKSERARLKSAATEISSKVSSWLAMQLLLSAAIGATTAIGLGLLGVPYFYVLALIAAMGEFIPYVGPVLAAIPGIGLALTSSWELGLGVAVFYFAQQQIENNVLVPKLLGNGVGLSAALVIIALLIGHSLLGVLGAVLAIPTAAIVQVVLQHVLAAGDEGAATP